MIVDDISLGRWLEIVMKTPNFLLLYDFLKGFQSIIFPTLCFSKRSIRQNIMGFIYNDVQCR